VTGWHGCEHLAPVREGDTLRSTITIEHVDYRPGGGGLVHMRSLVRADGPDARDVLDWRYVALLA
jgi:acyl dehydratase